MKKMLFTCLVLSAVSLTANAQDAARNKNKAATTTVTMAQSGVTAETVSANTTTDGSTSLTPAQTKAAEQKAEKNAKALKVKLGLNERQYAAVLEAEKTYQKEADKWPAGKIPSGHESNITWQKKAQIKAVLNEEQAKKYESLQSKTAQ